MSYRGGVLGNGEAQMRLYWLRMRDGLGFLDVRVEVEALAELSSSIRGGAIGKALSWGRGGAKTDRDPDSDRRMVQGV